ncbi:RNA polymerase sigma E factor [Bacteroidales bacterium]|nr:RNA polymerase sigma E factor [Bacteroidales bacterium]
MCERGDEYYIQLIKDGDANAFLPIVRRYQQIVFNIAVKIVHNTEDAEDIAQEIFIKVFQSISSFKGKSKFSTWLYRIAYNTALSELRRRQKLELHIEEDLSKLSSQDFYADYASDEQADKLRCLKLAMQILSPEDSLLITLFYTQSLSIEEVSEITNLGLSNIKVKLFRIRKKLLLEMNNLLKNEY